MDLNCKTRQTNAGMERRRVLMLSMMLLELPVLETTGELKVLKHNICIQTENLLTISVLDCLYS